MVVVGPLHGARVAVRMEVAVVCRRIRLVELVAGFVRTMRDCDRVGNTDHIRYDSYTRQVSRCLTRRVANRIVGGRLPCAIIRLPQK